MNDFDKARALLHEFKGDAYLFGTGVLPGLGKTVVSAGKRAALISSIFPDSDHFVGTIKDSLDGSGVELVAEISGARPNCPREDLFRITEVLKAVALEVVISFGGGSTIDAAKAAEVLRTLGGRIDDYFDMGLPQGTWKGHFRAIG